MEDNTKKRLIELAKADAANAGDNLYRAKIAARGRDASANWGQSGQTLQSIIDGYQKWYDDAVKVVHELGGSMKVEPVFTRPD